MCRLESVLDRPSAEGKIMKTLRSASAATLVLGLMSSLGSHAQPQNPPAATQKPGAAADAAAAASEKVTPEEAKTRRDWAVALHSKGAPKKGCFTAAYPAAEWREVQCVPAPNIPFIPRHGARPFIVGNTDDISAGAPSGTITQAFGHFENPVNVTSESAMINNTGAAVNNAYTLQINTNFMTSTACAGSPNAGCRGWEQWVHFNNGTTGVAFIQYWLIQFNAACPAGWTQFMFPPPSTDIYCFRNNSGGGVGVPNQPITSIANWTLSGTVTATADSVGMFDGTTLHTRAGDNSVNAAANWREAEFNIFGPGGGSQANFNNTARVNARTQIFYGGNAAPNCLARGTTGETNNLSFGPTAPAATAPGPAVIFQESIAGGSTPNCAAATTVGDTHLRTFNNLFYDFQAAGDFTLAEVAPGFEVQTRQVSGAPTWPNATVNTAVAARLGKTKVAICAAPEARVIVDGKATVVAEGTPVELPEGAAMRRLGNVYDIVDADGNTVRATLNSYGGTNWIDVAVGLGEWPSAVKGLIANVNGNVNQIGTRDNAVLTNPFNFDELYHRFADSWRVSGEASMLSACSGRVEAGAPTQAFYARDLEGGVREKARAVCAAAGVRPGALLDACTLDVAVIGRDEAAKAFVDAPQPAAVGTVTGGGGAGGVLGTWGWLILLLLVVLIIIVWLIMRKKP
jgi:hypothetical protein